MEPEMVKGKQFSRSVILVFSIVLFVLIVFATGPNRIITAQTGLDCSQIVPLAVKNIAASCNNLDKNQVCYGNSMVNVEYADSVSQGTFAKVGDIAPLGNLQSITTSPLGNDQGQWGLAVLKVQSNLPDTTPGQAVTFVMYGDTKVNGLGSSAATPSATVPVCTSATVRTLSLYAQPSFNAVRLASIPTQSVLNIVGRLADNSWLQVNYQGTLGWLNATNLKPSCSLDTIPVNDTTSPAILGGSGAFYFSTGIVGQASCQNVPAGGLLIRAPSGQKVAFRANGAEISIGSTVLMNAQPNQAMTLSVLSGQISVLSYGQRQTAGTGQTISVPLGNPPLSGRSDGLEVVGPPSIPAGISGDQNQYDVACQIAKALGGNESCTSTKPTPTATLRFVTRTPTPVPPTLTFTPAPANTSCTLSGFSANPNPITLPTSGGQACTTLSWDVDGVNTVFLNGAGVVGHGSQKVCMSKTSTYTLTLNCAGGSKSAAVTVNVK